MRLIRPGGHIAESEKMRRMLEQLQLDLDWRGGQRMRKVRGQDALSREGGGSLRRLLASA